MAGPFTREDFRALVPEDKKLAPEWVAALTARGDSAWYSGPDLDKIGMPVGGLCAGQVYLGGDGTLWHWDVFNQKISTGADHYAKPLTPRQPFNQGFSIKFLTGSKRERLLSKADWTNVRFCGEYPIGYVEYHDTDTPVSVALEVFSPFIPLRTEDSSLPATILEFNVSNHSDAKVELELSGWLENPVCLHSAEETHGLRRNRVIRRDGTLMLACAAEAAPSETEEGRPDITFEDFERPSYEGWEVTGEAFGKGPVEFARVPGYQGPLNGTGARGVNSHATAPGGDVGERDAATGNLLSRQFTLERNFMQFLIGGGNHAGNTCVNLLVEGKQVASATGRNDNRMYPVSWNVKAWAGKSAQIQVVDAQKGAWGNIGLDHIIFTDRPRSAASLVEQADFGTFALALLNAGERDRGRATNKTNALTQSAAEPFGTSVTGEITRRFELEALETRKVTFVIAWHMPNLTLAASLKGRHYAARFSSASDVVAYVAAHYERLSSETRLWHDTWYDSTLPWWFLDRTFLNTSILATATCHRFVDGRFYGWEGVGCCEGTCGHVWQYAHAVARLFPDLERGTRQNVDFGLAQQPDGAIHFRGEFNNIPAIDAQAGTVLRALREHQHSADAGFLRRNWPGIKKAVEWLLAKDADADGVITGNQHNTLDTDWFGPVAWLSGLHIAALGAAAEMAGLMNEPEFAKRCAEISQRGRRKISEELFNGEYFINKPDPKHLDAINSGTGCHIDQVFGQSWTFQVGLPRVLDESLTRSALKALWKYNFTPDVGPYRKAYTPGRWYAMPGEAGLLMCTFPQSDWDYAQAKGKGPDWAAGYFNECMNGFEYQVAGHMLWEGMVLEGMAITRAVHDRYHPSRRNPWNEVECGDHYARSMASYGVYLAACGYTYDGPMGKLGFSPKVKLTGEQPFKCAFTTAAGWGTYTRGADGRGATLKLVFGTLSLREFTMPAQGTTARKVNARCDGTVVEGESETKNGYLTFKFATPLTMQAGQTLELSPN